MNVVELSVSGNSKQEERSGKNIFKPFGAKTITANEVAITINKDNTITLNGTCTKNCWIEILYNFHDGSSAQTEKIIDLDPAKKYTFSLQKISGKVNNMYVNATFQLNAEGYGLGGASISTSSDGTSKTTQGTEGYDGIYRTYLYIPQGAMFADLVFGVQVEEGETMTEYEPYGAMPSPSYPSEVETVNTQVNIVVENEDGTEQQTKVVDIQQEMLEGDYFVKEEDGWKEVHGWNKKIFDGTENISITNNGNSFSYISSDILANTNINKVSEIFSNCYRASSWNDRNTNNTPNTISYYNIAVGIYKGDFATVEEFKADLAQKYTEGNPIYVWYKLATPTKLACTEKQSAQLDDLLNTSTYKNVTHIYSTDKVSPIIKIVYKKDLDTILNNQKNAFDTRLSNIEKLLSTTTTSSTLLNNLQKDIESEVI